MHGTDINVLKGSAAFNSAASRSLAGAGCAGFAGFPLATGRPNSGAAFRNKKKDSHHYHNGDATVEEESTEIANRVMNEIRRHGSTSSRPRVPQRGSVRKLPLYRY